MSNTPSVAIIAGEPSGDLHGSNLVRELKVLRPDLSFFGIGGDLMREQGVDLVRHARDMAVLGFSEVLGRAPFFLRVLKEIGRLLRERRPALLVLIDYPGFNLRLAREARRIGIPVVYYISPQVWAWGEKRLSKIRELVDHIIVIFPFEEEIYRGAGIRVTFVGHPLLDIAKSALERQDFCLRAGFRSSEPILGLLPGSRIQEVRRILPTMSRSAELIQEKVPGVQFGLGLAPGVPMSEVGSWMRSLGGRARIVRGMTYDLMHHSDLLLVASGTATLESAIVGTPMLIIYKVSPLSYFIAKHLVRIPDIGLVNVVAGKRIVPEFVQDEARPELIAAAAIRALREPGEREAVRRELREVREKLGRPGAAHRAAAVVAMMLKERGK